MSKLEYVVEPEVECQDNDPNDAAFVDATATIRGHNVVEEYVSCRMYPLAASFNFDSDPWPDSQVEDGNSFAVVCYRKHRYVTCQSCLSKNRNRGQECTRELRAVGV
jgi:hypothetical protein